jgi:prevent-host-death family protein
MSKTITLRDANQRFSRCVREVEAGEEFLITRNGKPVARLVSAGGKRVLTPEQQAARERTLTRMEKGWSLGAEHFSRDELYDEIIARKI